MRAVVSRALPRAAAATAAAAFPSHATAVATAASCRSLAMRAALAKCSGATSAASRLQRRHFATNEFIVHDQAEGRAGPLGLLGMDIQARDHIALKWTDGHVSRYHLLHLRAWCLCPACQHETGQRLVNSSDIDPDIEIDDIFLKGNTLNIVWAGADSHTSSFPWSWLRDNCYASQSLDQRARDLAPVALAPSAAVPTAAFARVMDTTNDEGLFQLLHQVVEHGVAVVEDTPAESGTVKQIAERIAPVSHAFLYGDTFDVVAEQDPVNIAYTTHHLKHHLDLAYYESPPGLQFLHALRFDATVTGGESTFVDVFAVASEFQNQHPAHFATLCRVPATFKKHHLNRSNPAIMEYQRPHIQLNHRNEVVAVHWSPPFEGPLKVPFDDVAPYYAAYKVFHDIVESGRHTIAFKLKQGDTVIFNQRRVLHGRTQFTAESNGVRHLQGTYVNIDDALCRFNALRYRFAADAPAIKNRRVANGNFA